MADVFISYSSKDISVCKELCAILEQRGIKCWVAPRDITAGDNWATAISTAISTCTVFMVIYSENSAASTQVPKEVNLASGKGKYIIPYKTDNTPFHDEFEYYLGTNHWIQADVKNNKLEIEELVATINNVVGKATIINNTTNITNNYAAPSQPVTTAPPQPMESNAPISANPPTNKSPKSKTLFVAATVVILALVAIIIILLIPKNQESKDALAEVTAATNADNAAGNSHDEIAENENAEMVKTYAITDLAAYETNGNVTVYENKADKSFSISGEEFSTGYTIFNRSDGDIKFNAEGKYTTLHFAVGKLDGSPSKDAYLSISIDGDTSNSITVKNDALLTEYDIDITGASQVVFSVEFTLDYTHIGVVDMYFC